MTGKRSLSYDLVRITAIAMVVMIHVSSYVLTYTPEPGAASYIVGNIFNAWGRAGTPMFLMLTGALLLDEKREKGSRAFYLKNLLNTFCFCCSGCSFTLHGGPS